MPRSLQKPHPPVWIAARSADTIEWALQRGYNQIATPWREPFEKVEETYNKFSAVRDRIKPSVPPKYAVSRMTYVGETDAQALAAMGDVRQHHRIFTHLFTGTSQVRGGFTAAEPVSDEYSEERLFEHLVAGSPSTCIEKLRRYEALGITHYIMYAGFPMDHDSTMRSMKLFAEEVMPHFVDSARTN